VSHQHERDLDIAMGHTTDQYRRFRELHESGCFIIPNPWDVGSARVLEQLGFKALATTSAGFAWSVGKADGDVALDEALAHYRAVAASVAVPVNADFEKAFATNPEDVAVTVTLASRTGIAGLSVEDYTGNAAEPLFDFMLAVDRVRAARRALDDSGTGVLLTARSEGFIVGRPDLMETIRRLVAFAEAGADCLYAPGLRTTQEIRSVVHAVAPKPVNVLANTDLATFEELAAIGVRRISVGGALARTAWTGFLDAAREIAGRGTFSALRRAVSGTDINALFRSRS
jgi:2-methylisocitrate lyase-like PEP mutase family enzyme